MKRMPVLKNISKKNLIPVIDFEEYNKSYDSTGPKLKVNFLIVYMSNCLRTLSAETVSNVLFNVPGSNNEEIVFKEYPLSKRIGTQELAKMLSKINSAGPGNVG